MPCHGGWRTGRQAQEAHLNRSPALGTRGCAPRHSYSENGERTTQQQVNWWRASSTGRQACRCRRVHAHVHLALHAGVGALVQSHESSRCDLRAVLRFFQSQSPISLIPGEYRSRPRKRLRSRLRLETPAQAIWLLGQESPISISDLRSFSIGVLLRLKVAGSKRKTIQLS